MVIIGTFKAPESQIKLEQRNIVAILDKRSLGNGTLYVSERTLSWQKEADVGFSLDYYNISLHAVSKDPNVYDGECIYILTDPHVNLPGSIAHQGQGDEDSDAESEPDLSELLLVPEDPSCIQHIYEAIKLCQELNPDPADVDDDDDDENLYADAEDEMFLEAESEQTDDMIVNNLAEALQRNLTDVCRNGNGDEDFEDAD